MVTLRTGAFRSAGTGAGRGPPGLGGGPRDAGPVDARPLGAGARRTR
jgi:hypothetical protein